MRTINLIVFFAFCMHWVGYSQDKIILFDYDEIYPITSTWADLMEPAANPLPNEVNDSRICGLFIHNAQWSEIEIRVEDITLDARYYNTIELKAFIPSNMPDGKVHITCKGTGTSRESRRRYDTYEITPPVKGQWFKIEHSFLGAYPIGLIQIGYRRSEIPDKVEDIAYFDDLSFSKTTSNDICLYRESFCIVYPENENVNFVGNPSLRAGNWVGNIDLTSTGSVKLVKYPNTTSHVLQISPTSANLVFPEITNLDGYDNLRVVYDARWVVDETKRVAFNSASANEKSPEIKAKIGSGNWNNVSVQPFTDSWQTQTIVISPESAQNLSLQIGKGNSIFDFEIDNVMIMGSKRTSALSRIHSQKLHVYPNPVKYTLFTTAEVDKIEIVSLQGMLLKSSAGNSVSVSDLSNGFYIVKLYTDGEVYSNKVLKN
jgi:hypothetical protein